MSRTAYTPETGSLAQRVCTWLQRNRDEYLTLRDIATKFDVPVQGLHFTLRDAMDHGWINRSSTNGSYSAGPRLPKPGEAAAPPPHRRREREARHGQAVQPAESGRGSYQVRRTAAGSHQQPERQRLSRAADAHEARRHGRAVAHPSDRHGHRRKEARHQDGGAHAVAQRRRRLAH